MKDYKLSEMKDICQRQFERYQKTKLCLLCDDCELKPFCHNAMIDDCPSFWKIEKEKEQ